MNLLQKPFFRVLVAVVSLGLCVSAASTIIDLWHRTDLITNRKKDLEKVVSENSALEKELAKTKTDGYIEQIARNKLGLVKNGETVVLLPQAPGAITQSKFADTRKNWQKWWDLIK